jgi:Flp pilus assembly pilin Flp
MKTLLKTFLRNDSGAALVEYGVALLVVILVGTAALVTMAEDVSVLFTGASESTDAVRSAACAGPTPPSTC